MVKYEFKTEVCYHLTCSPTPSNQAKDENKMVNLSAEGWQIVGTITFNPYNGSAPAIRFFMQRPLMD